MLHKTAIILSPHNLKSWNKTLVVKVIPCPFFQFMEKDQRKVNEYYMSPTGYPNIVSRQDFVFWGRRYVLSHLDNGLGAQWFSE